MSFMSNRSLRIVPAIAVVLLGATAIVPAALAQTPAPPRDAQAQGVQAQPGQAQPGQPPPGVIRMQPGQGLPPGMAPPGRRPPRPPSFPAAPAAPVAAAPASGDAHAGGGHGEAHHCPGHGPNDPPAHINWYQGLLGVDNEKAQSQRGLDRLLWRYHNEKDECDPKNQDPPLLGAVINFAVVLLIVLKFAKAPVMEALAKRKQTIMQDIDSANTLRVDAETRLESYKQQLAKIEERRTQVRDEFRAQWEQEKKRILEEAGEKAARLRKDAEFRVSQELKQARADLLAEAVEGSVGAAEEILAKRIQPADLDRLAEDYVSSIGSTLAASGARTAANGSPV